MKGKSLNPSQSTNWYCTLVQKLKDFNRSQRQIGEPEMEMEQFAYNNNIDLSGRTLIDVNVMP